MTPPTDILGLVKELVRRFQSDESRNHSWAWLNDNSEGKIDTKSIAEALILACDALEHEAKEANMSMDADREARIDAALHQIRSLPIQ